MRDIRDRIADLNLELSQLHIREETLRRELSSLLNELRKRNLESVNTLDTRELLNEESFEGDELFL